MKAWKIVAAFYAAVALAGFLGGCDRPGGPEVDNLPCLADRCQPSAWMGCEYRTWGKYTYMTSRSRRTSQIPNAFEFSELLFESPSSNTIAVRRGGQVWNLRVDPISCQALYESRPGVITEGN